MNALKDNPRIFNDFVPVAFHVDYWDYIGWKDIYADSRFGNRQRDLRRAGNIQSVYTPGFVVNGREWRRWFRGEKFPPATSSKVGILSGKIEDGNLTVTYEQPVKSPVLHVALLANGIETKVLRGENANSVLKGDFIVIQYDRFPSDSSEWKIKMPKAARNIQAKNYALATWITSKDSYNPIQATGTWLN